jgi:hypothetical protein
MSSLFHVIFLKSIKKTCNLICNLLDREFQSDKMFITELASCIVFVMTEFISYFCICYLILLIICLF